jgi:hypothetical protein
MRPLELSLVLVNLLTLGVLAVPQLQAVRWMGYVALIAVLIAVAQMIMEGPRWQMVPTYVLTGLYFLVWLLQRTTLAGRPVNRVAGLGHWARHPGAGDLCCPADREPRVSLSASKRALRDWHGDLRLGRYCAT